MTWAAPDESGRCASAPAARRSGPRQRTPRPGSLASTSRVVERLQARLSRLNEREAGLAQLQSYGLAELLESRPQLASNVSDSLSSRAPSASRLPRSQADASATRCVQAGGLPRRPVMPGASRRFDPSVLIGMSSRRTLPSVPTAVASTRPSPVVEVVASALQHGRRLGAAWPAAEPAEAEEVTSGGVRRGARDALAPVEQALHELRRAMSTLPAATGAAHTEAPPPRHGSGRLHLSSAEAGLDKAMDLLAACFDDSVPPKRLWPPTANTPPRSGGETTLQSPMREDTSASRCIPNSPPLPTAWACISACDPSQLSDHRSDLSPVSPPLPTAWACTSVCDRSRRGGSSRSPASVTTAASVTSPTSPPLPVAWGSPPRSKAEAATQTPSKLLSATSEPDQTSLGSVSPSLALSLSAFSPPLPGPRQLAAAALVQASTELAALAEAANCAAATCPESMPLVETLCTAVAKELVVLKAEQASASSSQSLDAEAAAVLSQRISELRAATSEGLKVLRAALDVSECAQPGAQGVDPRHVPTFSQTVSAASPSQHYKEKQMAQIFVDVASNMRQTLLEIRQAKERNAVGRSDVLMASPS